ncbi:MAG TPA: hypothetical protein V6C89_08805 [Drouetiella sp.]|jgi:hypothetical protein
MKKLKHRPVLIVIMVATSSLSAAADAQTSAGTMPGVGSGSSAIGGSPTGINSATTQSPTSTFQLQNGVRSSALNAGTQVQPISQPSTLIQNHAPVIQHSSFGVPTSVTDLSRQSLTPNALSTPNPVMPAQVNRSVISPLSKPMVPTYQKSQTLQQMQPQFYGSH